MQAAPKLFLALLPLAAVASYFVYDEYKGESTVQELCAKDGGLRGYKRANARGVLMGDQERGRRCMQCLEWLATGVYDYVDLHIPSAETPMSSERPGPGYFRYSLAAAGDKRCISHDPSSQVRSTQREDELRAGINSDRCVVSDPLPGRPPGYLFTEEFGVPIPNNSGRNIKADILTFSDSTSGEPVASYRNHTFFAKWTFLFALDSGSPGAAATCADPTQVGRDIKWFTTKAMNGAVPGTHVPLDPAEH
jgi:hypothetical protein